MSVLKAIFLLVVAWFLLSALGRAIGEGAARVAKSRTNDEGERPDQRGRARREGPRVGESVDEALSDEEFRRLLGEEFLGQVNEVLHQQGQTDGHAPQDDRNTR